MINASLAKDRITFHSHFVNLMVIAIRTVKRTALACHQSGCSCQPVIFIPVIEASVRRGKYIQILNKRALLILIYLALNLYPPVLDICNILSFFNPIRQITDSIFPFPYANSINPFCLNKRREISRVRPSQK